MPSATHELGHPEILPPTTGTVVKGSLIKFDLSASRYLGIGAFGRQAQVSNLLSRLMTHILEPTSDDAFNAAEEEQITRTFYAFLAIFPEWAPQPWPRYCGIIGMSYR